MNVVYCFFILIGSFKCHLKCWFEMSGTLLDINQTGKNSGVEQRSIDRVCLACVSKVAASNMSQKRISDFFKDGGGQKAKEKKSSNDGGHEEEEDEMPSSSGQLSPQLMLTGCESISEATSPVTAEATSVPDDGPVQPSAHSFPARRFGKETFSRSFNSGWFQRWMWIHYVKEHDIALCFHCCSAIKKGLIHSDAAISGGSFVKGGFRNWRKATEKCNSHEKSRCHIEAVHKLAALKSTPINALLSNAIAKNQLTAQTVLELAFRSLKFLGREGLPIRGQDHRDGVFWQLMLERTYADPAARDWLLRRDNWMGCECQNEILELLAHAVQRKIMAEAQSSPYYGLIADGTTDITSCEQFSCHLFYTDQQFTQKCQFLGFYNAADTTSETLFRCIKDLFLRLNLPLNKLQGYCFDGASNMSGKFSGVQARLGKECPGSLFVHCVNHSLDLVLQEVAREVPLISETLQFVQSVSVVIRESAKRKSLFELSFGEEEERCSLLGLCPTRWSVRATAISRVKRSFGAVLQTLQTLQQDRNIRGDTRSKIGGILKQAQKGKTMFGLICSESLFTPCEVVAKVLQAEHSTVAGVLECVRTLGERVRALRTEDAVDEMLRKTTASAAAHGLKMPDPNVRLVKTPSRFRDTAQAEDIVPSKGVPAWKREFFEAVDLVSCELDRRFDQSGMATAALRESVLLNAAKGSVDTEALKTLKLPENIKVPALELQLQMLGGLTKQERFQNLNHLATYMSSLHVQTRSLFKDVEALLHLCLSLPVSVASSERSFSALRRLKTWLRNTVTQRRLTHLALLHLHQDILDTVDIHAPYEGVHQRHTRVQGNLWSYSIW